MQEHVLKATGTGEWNGEVLLLLPNPRLTDSTTPADTEQRAEGQGLLEQRLWWASKPLETGHDRPKAFRTRR